MEGTNLYYPLIAKRLFQMATILQIGSIFGHTKYGIDYYYKYLKHIPSHAPTLTPSEKDALIEPDSENVGGEDMRVVRLGAFGLWNYACFGFLVTGLMNWKWASTGGPTDQIEEIIFWASTLICWSGGWFWFRGGCYQPLIPCWWGPGLTFAAVYLSRV